MIKVGGPLVVRLPMGTWFPSLAWEDSISTGATYPVLHNPRAQEPQLLNPLESVLHNKRSHCNEKPEHLNEE